MTVPFLDLGAAHDELRTEIGLAFDRVLASGQFILGGEVEAFEREFASFVDVGSCVGVANGLDALELAIRALGVADGDEVIVPSNTYIATWLAVTRAGGQVVPVEPTESTSNLDPARTEAAITSRTRGIVAVHLYGQPADMTALRTIADAHGLWLLEDAAQAHGARWDGRRCGSLGDAAAWSFYPSKNLGALGDGGAVTTDHESVAASVRRLRNYGSSEKNRHESVGFNSRLDEIQAAILRAKLPLLDTWNRRRRAVAERYSRELVAANLQVPQVAARADPVWHLYVIRSPHRDALANDLREAGIQTAIHYPTPPHLQPAYASPRWPAGTFPVSERLHAEVLSLPMGPHLLDEQVSEVIRTVTEG